MLGARLRASQRNMELMTPHLHLPLSLQLQQTVLSVFVAYHPFATYYCIFKSTSPLCIRL
jgi:hypothetical protein